MGANQIFTLLDREIFALSAPAHCVFMWTVERFLTECEENMSRRGYKRHCRFVWDKKNGAAPAFTVRYSHEYLIWYYKHRLLPIDKIVQGKFTTVFKGGARQHGRKPDFAYTMVASLYPDASKLDVFSREKRAGWHQYGDEPDFFNNNR